MAEFPTGQERLLKQLISTFRCSVCRRSFEREHVRVAARQEQLWIVSVRCSLCRNQQVFWVALKENGDETILRDLSDAEEEQFAEMDPVTADEILDMHEFLANFDGDFKAFFARRT
jgi:hypothetical protein